MRTSPCQNCQYRKPTCHDFCKEYLEWHEEVLRMKKAQALDRFLDNVTEFIIWRETRIKK